MLIKMRPNIFANMFDTFNSYMEASKSWSGNTRLTANNDMGYGHLSWSCSLVYNAFFNGLWKLGF